MNKKPYAGILALISAFALPQVSAADASGDWIGQLTSPFDSEYTAQYNHVTLRTQTGLGRRRISEPHARVGQIGRASKGQREESSQGRRQVIGKGNLTKPRIELITGVENREKAVIYARVSSREQEREGFSIPAQRELLVTCGSTKAFSVLQEFIEVETAKQAGRTAFAMAAQQFGQEDDITDLRGGG
jgi:hypothetical protein